MVAMPPIAREVARPLDIIFGPHNSCLTIYLWSQIGEPLWSHSSFNRGTPSQAVSILCHCMVIGKNQ